MTTTMVSGVVVVQMLFILPVRTKNATAIAEGAGMLRCRRSSYRIEQVSEERTRRNNVAPARHFCRSKSTQKPVYCIRERLSVHPRSLVYIISSFVCGQNRSPREVSARFLSGTCSLSADKTAHLETVSVGLLSDTCPGGFRSFASGCRELPAALSQSSVFSRQSSVAVS